MKKINPDIHSLRAMQIVISLSGITAAYLTANSFLPELLRIWAGVIILTIALGYSLVYLPMYFSSISCTVNRHEISVEKGVFIRKRQSVKLASVRYITAIDIPLLRFASFNTVVFFVYGGKLAIPFLNRSDMSEIMRLAAKEE